MKQSWLKLKNQVLGKDYDLSFAFAAPEEMTKLNKIYRHKDYSANVLSFPLSENSGEILINENYRRKNYGDYLFIHSLLHLKGFKHGEEMDDSEAALMRGLHPKNWEKIMSAD
ncbi:MAG: rRNA maturation RNAse YbeY [Candidatus Pacebacteria bacterium]|nr:rRNA maturation RNAse YbeY [Candidatus Paceibacterota bacterium]NUQ57124.1 rRNA maturation RNAse YbeY [Candidatus Paceibacter sp.]